jgi:predicted CopG family antitoxin
MRTTITLDDDVYSAVKEEMRSGEGKTFKESVNDLIRRGRYSGSEGQKRKKVKLLTFNMGDYGGLNLDKPRDVIEEIEGPWHR